MDLQEFQQFLVQTWLGEGEELCDKIRRFRDKLQVWNRKIFGNIFQKKRRCLTRLAGIQRALSDGPSDYLSRLELDLLKEYDQLLKYEEAFWCQKSRITWLKLGERNTKVFHQTAISKRRSLINRLKDLERNWTENIDKLRETARELYKSLYIAEQCTPLEEMNFDFPLLSSRDRQGLNRNVSEAEIKGALFHMGGFNAPGPDGLPPCFFQKKIGKL